MKPILNQQIIDKYILDEFGEIPNPINRDEMTHLINNNELTLEKVKLWSVFSNDLTIKGKNGSIILHSASEKGQLDIVQYVLDNGIDIDYLNDYKATSLMYASINGQIEVINYLLEKGTNINHQDINGWTALHIACSKTQLDTIKLLVENRINIYLNGYYKNETALDVAKYTNHKKIIDYLTPLYNN